MQQTSERIQQLWQRLQTVVEFSYSSEPGPASMSGWQGQGAGQVEVQVTGDDEIRFIEQGEFTLAGNTPLAMYNTYIWQQTPTGIRLSHGRRGEPVFLFELIPQSHGWRSAEAHVCIDDLYAGELQETADGFDLCWTIRGPKKDEYLYYRYRTG
ncbi:MAG: hypothetical protein CMI02_03015 [Oceanospirillaceae bacterium]|nr:hypothetical protein [Oceanospirillaceae bacterium]MBT10989.1 hypothetical protein [Oceanospirillaceae bacterium]|tara:strand:- start:15320 stop:15781 length:462 start_codon:yes stop_codon:yes gene_type:complete